MVKDFTYADLDLSFETNLKGDITLIKDTKDIQNNLINNVQILTKEYPYENGRRVVLEDYVHSLNDPLLPTILEDVIKEASSKDPRILDVIRVDVIDNADSFTLTLNVLLRLNINGPVEQNVIIELDKQ